MLTHFADLFDGLLVIAGLLLVVTGIVMFIRSKSSTDASSVEAFGIKLNVTHPSLILVLAGVGLMLAPRLLPELPGKGEKPEPAIVAEAPQPTGPSTSTLTPSTPALPAPTPATPVPSTPAPAAPTIPVAKPPTPQPAARTQATFSPRPSVKSTVTSTPTPTPTAIKEPQATPNSVPPPSASSLHPAPVVTPIPPIVSAPIVSAPPPPIAAPKPARPTLAYAALGLPTNRDFWSGETRATYTRRLHTSLQQAGRDVLRMDTRGLDLSQATFDAWWNESGQHPRSREYCAATNAPRVLLSARVETPTTSSVNESAYWPELKLRLYICASQRIYRQQKTLSPLNDDDWPFSTELNNEIERFMRTYRSDLTE